MTTLVERLIGGDRRALARLITLVENERHEGLQAVNSLFPRTGGAYIVGVTGPPGAGKSTLVDKLAIAFRKHGDTVGIVAVDPTSPFTGGAILGDRIRMCELADDPGVFIRSMGTRGALGGLALATDNVINLLDAFGKDVIIVETVGVGQSETDIVGTADTTLVVEVPGLGDGIQAIKAGILEIADIFVVNKADRPGADRLVMEIGSMLRLGRDRGGEDVPILKVIATKGEGVEELFLAVSDLRAGLERAGAFETLRRERRKSQFERVFSSRIRERYRGRLEGDARYEHLVDEVLAGRLGPYEASERLLDLFDFLTRAEPSADE